MVQNSVEIACAVRTNRLNSKADGVGHYTAAHPEAILVAEDRELTAHLLYRLKPTQYAAWNPDGLPRDHYELTTTLADKAGRDVIYMSRKPDIAARFESSETLGKVVVPIHRDFRREVHVFLLKGFKGY